MDQVKKYRSMKSPQSPKLTFHNNAEEFPESRPIFETVVRKINKMDVIKKIALKERLKTRAQTTVEGGRVDFTELQLSNQSIARSHCNQPTITQTLNQAVRLEISSQFWRRC